MTNAEARSPAEVSVAINPQNPDHMIAASIQRFPKEVPSTTDFSYVTTDAAVPSDD